MGVVVFLYWSGVAGGDVWVLDRWRTVDFNDSNGVGKWVYHNGDAIMIGVLL